MVDCGVVNDGCPTSSKRLSNDGRPSMCDGAGGDDSSFASAIDEVDCLLTVLFLMLMVLLMPLLAYAAIVYEFVPEPSEFEPEPSEAQVDTVNSADS
jgi:hypothetical protein